MNEPAHCSGTITRVDYCYYGPNQHTRRAWGTTLALYRSDGGSGYSRISDEIILAKYAPSIAPSSDSVLQLNQFKCETYVLGQALTVKVGDIFGAFIFTDGALFGTVGGLDLVGDSNNGYQMMRASGNVNPSFEVTTTSLFNIRLPEEIDQLSVDSERRVLHVYANISKSAICCIHANKIHYIFCSISQFQAQLPPLQAETLVPLHTRFRNFFP